MKRPSDRVRELETLLAKLRQCGNIELNFDMWERWGEQHATPEYRAEMYAEIERARNDRPAATSALEALVGKTRTEAPHEIEAWADAHDAYLAGFLADCAAKPSPDGVEEMVAKEERAAWAEVRAGTRSFVRENVYYVTTHVERYRQLFGIDPHTLERVE